MIKSSYKHMMSMLSLCTSVSRRGIANRHLCGHVWSSVVFRRNIPVPAITMAAASLSSSVHNGDGAQQGLKESARQIFNAGVDAVLPNQMVKDALKLQGNVLQVSGMEYSLDRNVHVVAFGKAVVGMIRATEDVLGNQVADGIASIPVGIQKALHDLKKDALLPGPGSKVKLMEGAKDNLPDAASEQAAGEISALTERLGEQDILLLLISGGGSALLPAPVPPITLEEKLRVVKLLASKGATIEQLNTVRKNLSRLKGGRLARMASPAKVISLILSDIIGDPLDLIASGPTVPDHSSPQDCLKIFQEFGISDDDIPSTILKVLHNKDDPLPSSLAASEVKFSHVNNVIIGSNSIAAAAAKKRAEELGFVTLNISNEISGEARQVGALFVDMAQFICEKYSGDGQKAIQKEGEWVKLLCVHDKKQAGTIQELESVIDEAAKRSKPLCVIGAGETTVTLQGKGRGGRNQELALAAGIAMATSSQLQAALRDGFNISLLSAGTDGQDAAGAFTDVSQVTRAVKAGLTPEAFLDANDSYSFFKAFGDGEDLLVTGLTGTNVMDLQILLVTPPGE